MLLDSIASNDRQQINLVCEGNLYRAFSEGLDDLNTNFREVQVFNKPENFDRATDDEIDALFDMEVIGVA